MDSALWLRTRPSSAGRVDRLLVERASSSVIRVLSSRGSPWPTSVRRCPAHANRARRLRRPTHPRVRAPAGTSLLTADAEPTALAAGIAARALAAASRGAAPTALGGRRQTVEVWWVERPRERQGRGTASDGGACFHSAKRWAASAPSPHVPIGRVLASLMTLGSIGRCSFSHVRCCGHAVVRGSLSRCSLHKPRATLTR